MNRISLMTCFLLIIFYASQIKAQVKKIDTTVKLNDVGFRIVCSNKSADENMVSISAVGFRTDKGDVTYRIQGKVTKAMADDMNNDGYPDIIGANHGLNSRFHASEEKPVRLYVGDFDNNGTVEQILTCYNGDSSWPMSLRNGRSPIRTGRL